MLVRDPFTFALDTRRRFVSDRTWLAVALLAAGIGAASAAPSLPWRALVYALFVVAAASILLVRRRHHHGR